MAGLLSKITWLNASASTVQKRCSHIFNLNVLPDLNQLLLDFFNVTDSYMLLYNSLNLASSKSVPKNGFWPHPVWDKCPGNSNLIFQTAVISEYVSKFGWDPFSDLRD